MSYSKRFKENIRSIILTTMDQWIEEVEKGVGSKSWDGFQSPEQAAGHFGEFLLAKLQITHPFQEEESDPRDTIFRVKFKHNDGTEAEKLISAITPQHAKVFFGRELPEYKNNIISIERE